MILSKEYRCAPSGMRGIGRPFWTGDGGRSAVMLVLSDSGAIEASIVSVVGAVGTRKNFKSV